MRSAFLALAIVFAFATVGRADDAKDINDTWKPAEGTNAGKALAVDAITLTITEGSKYAVKVAENTESGTFKFDAAKTPKTLDIMPSDGPQKGKTILAIYDLTADTLRVCYCLDGKTRPDKFESTEENKFLLIVYKRKK
jgi:uncharacterized protein (TIGR03067 family)